MHPSDLAGFLTQVWSLGFLCTLGRFCSAFLFDFCSEGDWVPFSAMSWAWMKDSNHFSGLTSAFRAAYEQSNLKVGLISAFDRHRSLKVGLISAFDRHTCINRSISADHALAHALEFGGEWRNLKKVSSTCISL